MAMPPVAPPSSLARLVAVLRRPQIGLPVAVVVGILLIAVAVQPGGSAPAQASDDSLSLHPDEATPAPSATPTASPTPRASASPSTRASASASGTAGSEVAGVRSTPGANSPVADTPDLSHETTQCGSIQETALPMAVEQLIAGVSLRVTQVAVYPVEYFRCILMATGGREATDLATAVNKAAHEGATHAVLIDLWVANGGRDFGQVNLKTAEVAAAGQTFAPLATLNGRGEVVVSSGEGRSVTLVVTLTNTVGGTTGPMTLTVDAPLSGGQQTAGKFQLFLPTP